jgi:hypothetical protein
MQELRNATRQTRSDGIIGQIFVLCNTVVLCCSIAVLLQ